jgi:hypothetical protein
VVIRRLSFAGLQTIHLNCPWIVIGAATWLGYSRFEDSLFYPGFRFLVPGSQSPTWGTGLGSSFSILTLAMRWPSISWTV